MILNVIYDIGSKTLMILCSVVPRMRNMIGMWFETLICKIWYWVYVTNQLDGLFCASSLTLRCEIWLEKWFWVTLTLKWKIWWCFRNPKCDIWYCAPLSFCDSTALICEIWYWEIWHWVYVTNKMEGLFCPFLMTLRCEIWLKMWFWVSLTLRCKIWYA